jgi:hypothetical protein
VLVRGKASSDDKVLLAVVRGLAHTREILFALSIGLRYLWFWTFIGMQPTRELATEAAKTRHSGTWKRWGTLGLIAQWTLFAAIIGMTILELLWRVVSNISEYGQVYIAASALEIMLSYLFLLKIIANVWISPARPRWLTLRGYALPLVSLLFGMGVAAGNAALCTCFSFKVPTCSLSKS